MMHFLFGRPGSGKTYRILQDIRAQLEMMDTPIWLIVPEQMAYSAERDILQALPPTAGTRFSIITFSRLYDLVTDRFGGRTQHTVTRAMKSLLMWQNLRELRGMLETYAHSAAADGSLSPKMLMAAEELSLNAISPQKLEAAAKRLDKSSPLHAKLRDLALVASAYDGLLTEVYGENPADRLLRAAAQIEEHDLFAGAIIYIDGFSSFTVQEYAILRPLIRQAEAITVTFSSGGREDRSPHVESITEAVRRMTRLCEDAGRPYDDTVLTETYRTASPELLALEEELWAFDLPKESRIIPPEESRGAIRLIEAPTAYDEAEAAALHILELAAAGVPYGEIAVVVRDTASWSGVLDAALDEYHIPFFLSDRTDLNEKPAARLILMALRCVARHWQAEDIIALSKTGLAAVSPRELDYFIEYVETWHLSGRRMTDTAWSMNPDGYTTELSDRGLAILQAANHVREVLMTPLLALERDLRAAENIPDQCRALYRYLVDLGVKEQLGRQAEEMLSLGQVREAGEQVRLWSFLTETLATVASVMEAAEPLTADEFGTALSLVFAETDIGSVPARHDCVTVGSAATLRVDHIRAALVLGLCEGEFPQDTRDDGLLSEQDKSILEELGIELDSRADRRMADELLYLWRAMTLPSETLILSRSLSTPAGQVHSPSAALTRLKFLFPYLTATPFSSSYLAGDTPPLRHRTPTEDRINRPLARALLGEEIWLSQSQLQTYAHCPYSYYGSHIMALRKEGQAVFDNLGAGVFLHHVMEQYLRRALDEENRLRPMEPEKIREVADAIISAYMEELCGNIAEQGRLLHLFDRLRQVALVLIEDIQAELSQSAFRVAGLEWDTHGYHPRDPQPMVLSLGGEDDPLPSRGEGIVLGEETSPIRLLLGGRIDRVDIYRAEDGETVYIRVVDYKSSKHIFTPASIVQDMNIQLLLYLFTLCSPENRALFRDAEGRVPDRVLPASAVYMSPDESDRDGAILPCRTGVILGDEEIIRAASQSADPAYLPSLKRNKDQTLGGSGLTTPEQMQALEGALTAIIRKTAAAMYDGVAGRSPSSDACQYCRMQGSCSVACRKK